MAAGENVFTLVARSGYAARGVVYLLAGGVCVASAVSGAGDKGSPSGALTLLAGNGPGTIALVVISLGLAGFFVWRMAQSLLNADDRSASFGGIMARISTFVSGLTYASLAYFAARLALNNIKHDGNSEDGVAATLMQQPYGPYLVGLTALIIIGVGVAQIYRGLARRYAKWVDLPPAHAPMLGFISSFGLVVRGILFGIAGGLFLYAAFRVEPSHAGSMAEALDWVRALPYGFWLYLMMALGLVAFGLYCLIEAVYRRVAVPDPAA